MSHEPTVSVRGEATLEVDPELALVNVSISVRERERDDTVRILSERGKALSRIVEGFGDSIEKADTSDLNIYPEMRQGSNDRVERYVGSTNTTITVVDFAVLSDLVVAVGAIPLAHISGPYWQLRRGSAANRAARVAATGDAVRRAREYAEAFGSTITGLIQVADQGMSDNGVSAVPASGKMSFSERRMMDAGGEPALDLQPVKQSVYGSIEARFSMTAPDLGGLDS